MPQIQDALIALRGLVQLPFGMQICRRGTQALDFFGVAHGCERRIIPGSTWH